MDPTRGEGRASNDEANHVALEARLQAQKMEALVRLAGGVAHDVNNLLMVVNAYTDQLIAALDEGDRRRRAAEGIRRAAARIGGFTEQLLVFSRRQLAAADTIDLNQVIGDLAGTLTGFGGEDVKVRFLCGETVDPVKADRTRIEDAIKKLVLNACEAMPSGGLVTIRTANVSLDERDVSGHFGATAGPHVMLAVADEGCGMTPEIRAHLFEPFFTTKAPGKGTGLGLAAVYGIVAQTGGHIDVQSEPGAGTTVKMYFPRFGKAVASTPQTAERALHAAGTKTILLVENEDELRHVLQRHLEAHDYRVLTAQGAREALHVCEERSGRLDAIVSDVFMPGMTGLELAAELALRYPQIEILLMSGDADAAGIRQDAGRDGLTLLVKPFAADELVGELRRVLG